MTAEPIKYPVVTPSQLQLSQILCHRQNIFSFTLGENHCTLELKPSEPIPSPEFCLTLEINSQPVQFFIGRSLINQLLASPLNDQSMLRLPEEIFKAAMVHSLTSVTELLSATLGSGVTFINLEPVEPDILHSGLALNLTLTDSIHTALIVPNPMLLELLTHLPAHIQNKMPDIPIWAELILGRSILSRLEVSTLATGDIVFLQQHVTGQQLVVRASRQTAFVGEAEGSRVTIRQRMELMDEQHPETHEQAAEQAPLSAGVDMADLSVELLFEIGRQQFSAREIEAMQEGYIFDLERPIEQPVRIRANGKVIAECQLVQIDNRLGARIIALTE